MGPVVDRSRAYLGLRALVLVVLATMRMNAQLPEPLPLDTLLYSPAVNLERTELEMLRNAHQSIDIAMYSFTDRELANELVELARSGVRIRVYRDRTEYKQETERSDLNTTAILIGAGVQVRVKGARDLMHLKSYCIDGRMVRTGSANWSPTGLKRQDNDIRYEFSYTRITTLSGMRRVMYWRVLCVLPSPVSFSTPDSSGTA